MNKNRHNIHNLGGCRSIPWRGGFTLIEMLISVSLVLLMMVLFAEIFGLASNAMTLQRAIADNDQQVRSFTTVFRADLQKRTYRTLTPYDAAENSDFLAVPYSSRQGYFYLQLNDPDNQSDNVLQFTVRSTVLLENGDDTPYYGKASGLVQLDPPVGNNAQSQRHVRANSQQPEHDDGELQLNFTAASTAAEISYFMRGARLYRRVVLLRDPLPTSGNGRGQPRMTWDTVSNQREATPIEYFRMNISPAANRIQTQSGQYAKYDSASGTSLSDDYWDDFDYQAIQAIFKPDPADPTTWLPDGASLVGTSALENDPAANGISLGIPRNRFGFDQVTGISREFSHADPSQAGFFFLGRYTLEEMSNSGFNFPQTTAFGQNPFSYTDVPALTDAEDSDPDGAVDAFAGGPRRGEDLLLSNVHAFEIDVWDDRIGAFLPLGHNEEFDPDGSPGSGDEQPGDYSIQRQQQIQQATPLFIVPGDGAAWQSNQIKWLGRSFDTWHASIDFDNADGDTDDTTGRDPAPYRAMTLYPPGAVAGPFTNNGLWQTNTDYVVGDQVFPVNVAPNDFSFYYVCTRAGTSGPNPIDEPAWVPVHGATMPVPVGSTLPQWQAVFNLRPLRSIRIRVRFLHESSGEMRQVSLIQSLVD